MIPQKYLDACETVQVRAFLLRFLDDFPPSRVPYLQLQTFPAHHILISSLTVSRFVYILLRGTLCAMENRIQNQPFVFAKLYPGAIVGDYELFAQTDENYATILSVQPCVCLKIPADVYLDWITHSQSALLCRLQTLVRQLGDQTLSDRQYFYMDYETRCISVLLQTQPSDSAMQSGRFLLTREELAGKIGCSLRTCHRIIKHLVNEKMISLVHGKIVVDDLQRQRLQRYIQQKIDAL